MTLCLDISGKCTGYSIFDSKGKLMTYDRITPNPKDAPYDRLVFVAQAVIPLMKKVDNLVIEGIFLGKFKGMAAVTVFEYLAKIAGAIIYVWLIDHDNMPTIYKAVEARKLAGIKGNCQKAEVQLFILSTYKMYASKTIREWKAMMEVLYEKKQEKEYTLTQFKYRANKLSKLIDVTTGLGEDTADSILLGIAYNNDK